MVTKKTVTISVGVLLLFMQYASAADVYRCGNNFQDTPCAHSNDLKKVKSTVKETSYSTQKPSTPPFNSDADCRQRGDAAKKIMWLREVGKTKEQQVESAQDQHTKALVENVYNHRGTSIEVKNAIEQECMQQKEQDKLAHQLMIESQRLRGNVSTNIDASTNDKAPIQSVQVESNSHTDQQHTNHDRHEEICSSLKTSAERIATQRRRGGSASYMNNLKQKQEEIQTSIRASDCQ